MTRPRGWLAALLVALCLSVATGARCDDRQPAEPGIVPPDRGSLVRAILRGGDEQLRVAALWLRAF